MLVSFLTTESDFVVLLRDTMQAQKLVLMAAIAMNIIMLLTYLMAVTMQFMMNR
jgi:hypothetical protein